MPTPEDPKFEPNETFEQFLREFRPIAPPTLHMPQTIVFRHALAAAFALILAAIIALLGWNYRQVQVARAPTLGDPVARENFDALTLAKCELALRASDQDLALLLDNASPSILAHDQRGSLLYELGKE
jgi:hypothetical protein